MEVRRWILFLECLMVCRELECVWLKHHDVSVVYLWLKR